MPTVHGACAHAVVLAHGLFVQESWTPLHYAETANIVAILVQAGANLEARASSGETPLIQAACNNRIAVVRALVRAGAKLDATYGPVDFTARDVAHMNGFVDATRLLERAATEPSLFTPVSELAAGASHRGAATPCVSTPPLTPASAHDSFRSKISLMRSMASVSTGSGTVASGLRVGELRPAESHAQLVARRVAYERATLAAAPQWQSASSEVRSPTAYHTMSLAASSSVAGDGGQFAESRAAAPTATASAFRREPTGTSVDGGAAELAVASAANGQRKADVAQPEQGLADQDSGSDSDSGASAPCSYDSDDSDADWTGSPCAILFDLGDTQQAAADH